MLCDSGTLGPYLAYTWYPRGPCWRLSHLLSHLLATHSGDTTHGEDAIMQTLVRLCERDLAYT